MTTTRFPVYRKYKNNKSFFKISSLTSFIEVQIVGSKKVVHRVEAKTYPEKLFINDMLYNYRENWDDFTEAEFEQIIL